MDHNKLWKILQETAIPDHLTCLLRNLYAGQEITVRTEHGTTDWFQTGKGVHQGCILSPCFFNFYEEYIMRNARLDEAQAGIKVAGRNINNLRYANDTTPMAESKELKSLLMWNNFPPHRRDQIIKLNLKPWGKKKASWWKWKRRVKKTGLKLNIQKTKIMASGPITSWQRDGETMETVTDFIWGGGLQNYCRWWLQPWN